MFCSIFYLISECSINLIDEMQVSYSTFNLERKTLLPLLLILSNILLTLFYLLIVKMLYSQIPSLLLPVFMLLFSIPIAFILSLHRCPDKSKYVYLNMIPIFFEAIALNYLIN